MLGYPVNFIQSSWSTVTLHDQYYCDGLHVIELLRKFDRMHPEVGFHSVVDEFVSNFRGYAASTLGLWLQLVSVRVLQSFQKEIDLALRS